jgi:predicted RNase H-like HicB family nuclease
MKMNRHFTAVVKKDEGWWIGWVQEIPGVNSQGKTRTELLKNLRSALREALELNREAALAPHNRITRKKPSLCETAGTRPSSNGSRLRSRSRRQQSLMVGQSRFK